MIKNKIKNTLDKISNKNLIGMLKPKDMLIVPKGWGYERWLWNNEDYCCKELFFFRGKFCSWHYHEKKDEIFRILTGRLLVEHSQEDLIITVDDEKYFDEGKSSWTILEPGDVFHVPRLLRHKMKGINDCLLIEVSTQHFEEDSIKLLKGD